MRRFGSAGAALEALPHVARAGGRRKPLRIPGEAEILREIDSWNAIGADLLTIGNARYPALLAETEDAPPVFGVMGDPALLERPMIGIVGARNASANGLNFARRLAGDLAAAGLVVVSGLARGIDAAAHKGALDGGTVGVLGCGLDVVYPPQNRDLFTLMREQGAIASEFPPGTPAQAANFPRRNRLISGMARAVAVIEANRRSGSLITARLALEQGREVFAVPGFPLDPRSEGPNWLLRQGATLLENADDIIGEVGPEARRYRSAKNAIDSGFSAAETVTDVSEDVRERLYSLLSSAPVTVDELVDECHVSHQEAATALLELELAGRVQRLPGNRVAVLILSD